jgi:hypothetical protein
MRYVIIAEVRSDTKRERWRGIYDNSKTLHQIAREACGSEFRWFTVVAIFTEAEYTKEKGEMVWREFKRLRAVVARP